MTFLFNNNNLLYFNTKMHGICHIIEFQRCNCLLLSNQHLPNLCNMIFLKYTEHKIRLNKHKMSIISL